MRLATTLVLALTLSALGAQAAEPKPAPPCPVPALHGTQTLDPAALPGKVVYLDFWASWCGPCAAAFPVMQRLHQEFQAQGLEILAINLDEDRQDALDFLGKVPVDFRIGLDPLGNCPGLYGVKAMPTSYLIDRKGRIREVHAGFRDSDADALRAQVQALLAEP